MENEFSVKSLSNSQLLKKQQQKTNLAVLLSFLPHYFLPHLDDHFIILFFSSNLSLLYTWHTIMIMERSIIHSLLEILNISFSLFFHRISACAYTHICTHTRTSCINLFHIVGVPYQWLGLCKSKIFQRQKSLVI